MICRRSRDQYFDTKCKETRYNNLKYLYKFNPYFRILLNACQKQGSTISFHPLLPYFLQQRLILSPFKYFKYLKSLRVIFVWPALETVPPDSLTVHVTRLLVKAPRGISTTLVLTEHIWLLTQQHQPETQLAHDRLHGGHTAGTIIVVRLDKIFQQRFMAPFDATSCPLCKLRNLQQYL